MGPKYLVVLVFFCFSLAGKAEVVLVPGFDSIPLSHSQLQGFQPDSAQITHWVYKTGHPPRGKVHRFQFNLRNPTRDTQEVFLNLPVNDYWVLRQSPGARFYITGHKVDYTDRQIPSQANFLRLKIPPGTTANYKALTGSFIGRQAAVNPIWLLSPESYYQLQVEIAADERKALSLDYMFMGALSLMMLYMFILFFQNNRDPLYLYYALYMLCALLYMGPKFYSGGYWSALFSENRLFYSFTNEPAQILLFICYNLFVMEFLSLRERYPRLWYTIMGLNTMYLLYLAFVILYHAISGEVSLITKIFPYSHAAIFGFSLYLLTDLWINLKSPLKNYILLGSLFFATGSLLSLYYSILPPHQVPGGLFALSFMKLGMLAEILCFSLGIGRKIKIVAQEKEQMQKAYINQLKRNEELNRLNQQKLEKEVEQRSAKILSTSRELEQARADKLRAQYERELSESKLNNLRLQMNPHFIFNSLNSIRHLIMKRDFTQARNYVTGFARLLRIILDNAKQKTVALAQDLEALKLYVEFEQRRFEQKFSFSLQLAPEVNPESVEIQPLLIQPFVENAIWHGLMHKSEPGKLSLEIAREKDYLRVIIEDNGIGRKKAREINADHQRQKSYGMAITQARLELMNRIRKEKGRYKITDLTDDQGRPSGTRVELLLKI